MTMKNSGLRGGCYRYTFETPGSGGAGEIENELSASEDSSSSKWRRIGLYSKKQDNTFGVPTKVFPLDDLSSSGRKDLIGRLRRELERIQSFQKKVEVRQTHDISVSSSSCINGQIATQARTFGKSRGSTGSGKKVNPLNVARPAPVSTATMHLMKKCEELLKRMMSHKHAWVFSTPVDVVKLKLPDYFTVIKHPMDLGTIKSKLTSGTYSSPLEFAADVRLTFMNAMSYNPPGHEVHIMADTLSKFFEVRWKTIEKKLLGTEIQPASPKGARENGETATQVSLAKKRKISSVDHECVEPVKQVMPVEERHKLGRELESMGDIPVHIVNFLREHSSNGKEAGEDEIEIDIDILSNDTLFSLRRLVDGYLLEKREKQLRAKPCEIELFNESGPSNSSMQYCDGNEMADEDVDIVENEPPVSSHSPVKIEKDAISSDPSDSGFSSSEIESDGPKATTPPNAAKRPETMDSGASLDEKTSVPLNRSQSFSGLDQLEDASQDKPSSVEADHHLDGNSAPNERQVSSEKLYRAALLRNRYADLILKSREKALSQNDKKDPEKLRQEREELELQKKKEKARLQAEARAAEEARKQAEAEAAAKVKRKRELEREAARQALLKMEKTVEINESSRFLEDLEMLKIGAADPLPSSVEEASPDLSHNGLGSFNFGGGSNPLEQLGLFMKDDEEEDEPEQPSPPKPFEEVEEGEID